MRLGCACRRALTLAALFLRLTGTAASGIGNARHGLSAALDTHWSCSMHTGSRSRYLLAASDSTHAQYTMRIQICLLHLRMRLHICLLAALKVGETLKVEEM